MIKRLRIVALWPLALLLVVIAANSNEPYLVHLRGAGQVVLLVVSAGVPILLLRCGAWREGRVASRILLLLWCMPLIAFVAAQTSFAWRKYEVLTSDAAVARLLGAHFVVGYAAPEEAAVLAERGLIGGVYVTRHNASGRTAAELKAEIAALQARRAGAGLPRLIVTADQEGGIVAHLSPPLPHEDALSSLADLAPERRRREAEAVGRRQGAALADVGVTLNLAPVLDLRPDRQHIRFDFNTLIGQRAIASDPAVVSEIATSYIHGLAASGVGAAVKHFPGLGRVTADTHQFAAQLQTPVAELAASDWRPFREVLKETQAVLMVGHVKLEALDPKRPASHSKAVLDGLIRQSWNYNGIIITDDLVMGAIYGGDVCKAVVEALNGGADLLLVAYDGAQFYRIFGCARRALEQGQLDFAALARSEERLRRRHLSEAD
ncbi:MULTISPECIES: glycoside hydrolase family 3 N-terminal domain-containing protein [unclassified Bradyrhizobium]|uniref:glycoside hydrolase family 3 N-terminal domain-containing protein n=1 Tax=unclassified Bradyrhizobium TaxID=2631580 RepID=UPI0028E8E4DA|nr:MULTISPECIES: glycoside hydrolase family 3 N-terminal domain-containing protein [unclassified Bradyrhizobium]